MNSEKHRVEALAAGQTGWGQVGSASGHIRYMFLLPGRWRNRRKCYCGCGGKSSHGGAANGLTLVNGCELSMRRWVKTGEFRSEAEIEHLRAKWQTGER